MARVLFLRDYPYTPSRQRRVTIKYRAARDYTVKRECADAAMAAGAAVAAPVPPRRSEQATDV